jgi:hypothetical protein
VDGSRRLGFARKGLYALVGLGIFAGGATLSSGYKIDLSVAPRPGPASDGSYYVPAFKVQSGPQLVMVYVGSSTCPWANQRSLPEALETIKVRLAAVAREHGMGFKAVGLALDWSPERGIAHLKRFGHFDEIAASGSWGGTLALRYLWSDAQVAAATPQVLVYTRMFLAPAEATDPFLYEERERRTRAVRRGFVEIAEWAESGAALDLSVPGAARTDPADSTLEFVSDESSFSHEGRHGS